MNNNNRSFWIPYDVSYSDYFKNRETKRVNKEAFVKELNDVVKSERDILYPLGFLYYRDEFAKNLERLAVEKDGNKAAFMKAAIDELSYMLSQGKFAFTEGEAIAIGIELGRYLALFDAVEKFDVVFSKLKGVDE